MPETKVLHPLKAIRANCINCVGGILTAGYQAQVRNCTSRMRCPLWPYRFGMGLARAIKQGKDVVPTPSPEGE